MKSINAMIDQCEGLIDTRDITAKESDFLQSLVDRKAAKQEITGPQSEWLERIFNTHFAG